MAKLGRPLDYNVATIDKANEYIKSCQDTLDQYGKSIVKLPSISGLALYLDVTRETVYDWKSKYPEFSYILGRILLLQEEKLINSGLGGQYNSAIAKLALGKHGYHEKNDTTISGDPEKPLVTRIERTIVYPKD